VEQPREPLPLEYAGTSEGVEPVRHRLVLGMLSLIGSVAAGALLALGVAMRGGGGGGWAIPIERRLGMMAVFTSVAVGALAMWVGLAARSRGREGRGVVNLALATNVLYWVAGLCALA
jgi:hypothetical protein